MIGIMFGAVFWPLASMARGLLRRRFWRVIGEVEAGCFGPEPLGKLFVWSMALAAFLIYVPDREGAYAPFRPIMLTLLCTIVLLCCARSGWWLATGSARLAAIQADEGRGRREGGMVDATGKESGISAATAGAEHPDTGDRVHSGSEEGQLTPASKIAIFDLKEMAIFAVFALVVAAVVAFSLILQPFG